MRMEDVDAAIQRMFSQPAWRLLTDADERHLIQRIQSFPPEQRQYFGNIGCILGLSPEFMKELSFDERGELLKTIVAHNSATTKILSPSPSGGETH
jgi:hypothetical protein